MSTRTQNCVFNRLLGQLQQQLETIYDIEIGHQIADFTIHDTETAHRLGLPERAGAHKECLLIRAHDDALDVSLFIAPQILRRLAREMALATDDYLSLAEGVSHFVYLLWNAQQQRQIAPLDLELQGEIDKFVLSLIGKTAHTNYACGLEAWRTLFSNPNFDPALRPDELERYRVASSTAADYCQQLQQQYLTPTYGSNQAELYLELRRFYRLRRAERFRLTGGHP